MEKISFEGIGEVTATFRAKSGLVTGKVAKVTGAGEMGPCGAGERFCGVALHVDGGLAAVQVKGFITVPCSGSVSAGWVKLAANGSEYLVTDVDLLTSTATVLL